ncbi:hypothetical protein N9318_03750 [Euryarchaeota archaeon]|nr:hypothetical protein [Euryarchaeota archaeon]
MPVEFNRKTKLLSPIAYFFLSGSFNNSLDDSEEESDGDGLDLFVDLADSVA